MSTKKAKSMSHLGSLSTGTATPCLSMNSFTSALNSKNLFKTLPLLSQCTSVKYSTSSYFDSIYSKKARNILCFKPLDLIWLIHFTRTDITLSNFRHLLQRACWWIMQCRAMASSTPSSSSIFWTSATSPFFLLAIDGAPSVVIPAKLFHCKPAIWMPSYSWWPVSFAVVWPCIGITVNNYSINSKLSSTPRTYIASCAVSVMSVASWRTTEYALKHFAFSHNWS